MLKIVTYLLLTRKDVSPDLFLSTINNISRAAPGDYFRDSDRADLLQLDRDGKDGFHTLIHEGLLISAHLGWEQLQQCNGSFDTVQQHLRAVQFLEDLVLLKFMGMETVRSLLVAVH